MIQGAGLMGLSQRIGVGSHGRLTTFDHRHHAVAVTVCEGDGFDRHKTER
jgi:hypothetical protein